MSDIQDFNLKRIVFDKKEGLAKITLNRPEVRNCLDYQTLLELECVFGDVENDPALKVAAITGAGDCFSSGADLKYLGGCKPSQLVQFTRKFHQVITGIERLSKPVIAAINGMCIAGGLELAMGCDILIADEKAQLSDHHTNIGGIPGGGSEQRLARIVGIKRALEIILTGKRITSQEAKLIGLVNQVAPAGKLWDEVGRVADVLISKNPWSMKTVKYLIYQGMQVDLSIGLEMEIQANQQLLDREKSLMGTDSIKTKPRDSSVT